MRILFNEDEVIESPELTVESGAPRIGVRAHGIDVARYKTINALVLRAVHEHSLGIAIEIPMSAVVEVIEAMTDYVDDPRPVEEGNE